MLAKIRFGIDDYEGKNQRDSSRTKCILIRGSFGDDGEHPRNQNRGKIFMLSKTVSLKLDVMHL